MNGKGREQLLVGRKKLGKTYEKKHPRGSEEGTQNKKEDTRPPDERRKRGSGGVKRKPRRGSYRGSAHAMGKGRKNPAWEKKKEKGDL